MNKSIGQRIREKREENNLTQNQVSEKLYITQQTVARWENDKHTPPIKAVQDLAKLFNVDTSYFFGEDRIIVHQFNFFAFIGSLILNCLFFWIIAVVLVSIQLAFWGTALACTVAPIVLIWQVAIGTVTFSISKFIASLIMTLVAVIIIPILWKITKYMCQILRTYYRYNINSIVYEVTPRVDK
ncbi:Helix-turn-helix XRE-family transcriptional regulator [Paucilactobacillus oligofermentans DSM 15707 = LMG 22743]|nr:helix-turn-helix domain-containing protein [Paucilactobacillus oligofermentans]CUS25395.1 Helix-turn-helix XRE-family transcriptional regulator [Paucilactobacillus oligofermentans DSM 15707 = LMG 22743]